MYTITNVILDTYSLDTRTWTFCHAMDYNNLEIIHPSIEVHRLMESQNISSLEEMYSDQSEYCSNWLNSNHLNNSTKDKE